MIQFRGRQQEIEYGFVHPNLRYVVLDLERWLGLKGLDLHITSIYRAPGTIEGESGVHGTLRALDCIPDGKEWNSAEMKKLAAYMNQRHPRPDGKKTVLWHSHRGGGIHFHLQVPWTKDFNESRMIESLKKKIEEK